MAKAVYRRFFEELTEVVSDLDKTEVKRKIGDSTSNNRTLTVNQVIRFLTSSPNYKTRKLGRQLSEVRGLLSSRIAEYRRSLGLVRNDSFEISEIIKLLENDVLETPDTTLRSSVGRAVGAV